MKQYQYFMLIVFFLCSVFSFAEEKQEWEYSFIKALNYEEKNELDKAIGELEKSRALDSGNPIILRELGYCYGKQGNLYKAKKYYEEVLTSNPEDINALKNLALIVQYLEEDEKTLEK